MLYLAIVGDDDFPMFFLHFGAKAKVKYAWFACLTLFIYYRIMKTFSNIIARRFKSINYSWMFRYYRKFNGKINKYVFRTN